ncbi:unnamed protein product [Blepharisma stoltei]|uniref:Uncharacterized protein n=1 Tax=Blepharisma stoltei TaxID=1481888 RepID=A0AAU9ICR8_9CILI|nr:unnamed protein product [Blepharisma stoltei]
MLGQKRDRSEKSSNESLINSFIRRRPNKDEIRAAWLDCISTKNYSLLYQALSVYSQISIGNFFLKGGKPILHESLFRCGDLLPLRILIEKVPKNIILAVFKENKFSLLKNFIIKQSTKRDPEDEKFGFQKLKLLINIDKPKFKKKIDVYLHDPDINWMISANMKKFLEEEMEDDCVCLEDEEIIEICSSRKSVYEVKKSEDIVEVYMKKKKIMNNVLNIDL